MGLYLAVFDGDAELDGVEVGSYADFGDFRELVAIRLEAGAEGSRFPTLMLHSDCDGEWSPEASERLLRELRTIESEFSLLPPVTVTAGWKGEVLARLPRRPANLADCCFDIDGEPLITRLIGLTELSVARRLPILFQ